MCYKYLFIHAWNHYYTINVVSSSGVVVMCTLERKNLFLGLAVTEIVYRARPILSLAKSWGLRPALITRNTPKRVSKLHALNDEKCLKASWLWLSIVTAQGYKLCIQSVVRLGLPLL